MVLPFVRTFGDVPVGEPLIFIDSRGRFSLALNQRDFAAAYKITPPTALMILRK
jgi:S-adenosylmethionine hydrolase